jgi:integrase
MTLDQPSKLYTEPKISPAEPESSHMTMDWYVWFRFFDASTGTWKQLRYKKGINEFKNFRERLAEANALKQAIKEELRDGWNPLVKDKLLTIRIYSIEEALNHIIGIKEMTLKTKTKYAYRYIINLFIEWLQFKGINAAAIKRFTPSQAQEYMDWMLMKKKYSGRTFNDHLIVLRTFFNCFVEREWVHKNPFKAVKRKTQTVGRNLAYSDHERTVLEKELYEKDRRLYFFTQIMFHCFIRRSEMVSLKVKHIDMLNKTIIIPGENSKNKHQESVVIPKGLEPIIEEMQLHKYSSEDFLFGRKLMTSPVQYKNANWITSRHGIIVRKLKMDIQKNLYSWKHTGVCCYYNATKDPYAIMRQLRHRDLNTTMIYLKSMGLIQNDAFRNAMVA